MSDAELRRLVEGQGVKTRKAMKELYDAIVLHDLRLPDSRSTFTRAIAGLVRAVGAEDDRTASGEPSCRLCGCTEHNACVDDERGACSWAAPDICSHCADSIALLQELITGESPTDRVERATGDVGEITLPIHHAEQLLTIVKRLAGGGR